MTQKTKRTVPLVFLIFAASNLFTYTLYHVASLIKSDLLGSILEYLGYYMLSAIEFLTPPILATVILIIFAHKGMSKALSSALIIAAARVFYVIPSSYMQYFYDYGSLDAIVLSLLASLRVILITVIGVFASLLIVILLLRTVFKKSFKDTVAYLPELLAQKSSTDFLAPINLPVLVFVLLRFFAELISEIFYTVAFFITYGSDYSGAEILSMLSNYVILFVLLIAGYLLSSLVKNVIAKSYAAKEAEEKSESDS